MDMVYKVGHTPGQVIYTGQHLLEECCVLILHGLDDFHTALQSLEVRNYRSL